MSTVSTFLKKSKTNAKGEHPVVLRLADSGNKRVYFSTGFYATEKQFDTSSKGGRFFQGKGVRPFNLERKEEGGKTVAYTNKTANDKLGELEGRALEILKRYSDQHVSWSLEQFRVDFESAPRRAVFYEFAKGVIDQEYAGREKFKRVQIANDALASFVTYDDGFQKKMFQDINAKYLQGYVDYAVKKGNSPNTISIRMREIRRFFNIAIRDKVITPELYPFSSGKEDGKVRIPQSELSKTDQYLTLDNLKALANTSFKNAVLERTRHLFLFSYYCRGMNWKDMALLTKENFYQATVTDETTKESKEVVMLQYRRSKTKGEFDIQVTPNIRRELDWFENNTETFGEYVLPIISVEVSADKMDEYLSQIRKRFNASLKTIAKKLKFPESQQNITIYTARHSFAMTLKNKDKSIEIISQALGHQSVETTKHYLAKFSTTKMAEETDIDLS
jgi:site-specific recombinase XerD